MKITKLRLTSFLELAGERLTGNWVVIGGSVMALIGAEYRVTNDIDLSGPITSTQKDTLILMEIAESLGLPIEAINQAGAFFLKQIPGWEKRLIEVHRGKGAIFFRPNATLYLQLKIRRFSETDLLDCMKMLEKHSQELEFEGVNKLLRMEMKTATGGRLERLTELDRSITLLHKKLR